jgi:hypothetical protein
MKHFARCLLAIILTIGLLSPLGALARPAKQSLSEDAALDLLFRTLKQDHVYDKRVSLDCVTSSTDEITRTYYEFALHEKHGGKCGGDPETNPVVDRYRVRRASGDIELYDVVNDTWHPYKAAKIK